MISSQFIPTDLTRYEITVLLIDDQPIIAEAIRRMLANEKDITFHYCSDPTQALHIAKSVRPTVILQDLVMPEIDGLLLVRYFRANPSTSNIPLIVLSTKEESKIKAEAFALGANDYIVKIPDSLELIARIRYHSQGYISLLERNEAYDKLLESQKILYSELAEAAEYVKSQLPSPLNTSVKADWEFIPSTKLGGDAFNYQWLDADHFAMYLLDVCGHGVGAALLSISIMNVLRTHTLPQADLFNPSSVLKALNDIFPMENHNNMFFTMWYGVYNKQKREINYASGGHPPAVLLTGDHLDSLKVIKLETGGLVVGGMSKTFYHSNQCHVDRLSKLYVFSDGVYELIKPDNKIFTLDEFIEFIAHLPFDQQNDLESILHHSQKINGHELFADDYSIVRFIFDKGKGLEVMQEVEKK